MTDAVPTLLWNRVRAALELRGAWPLSYPTTTEAARHAQTQLGIDR